MADRMVIGLVACATGGSRTIRNGFVEPALLLDRRVAVTEGAPPRQVVVRDPAPTLVRRGSTAPPRA